MKRPQQVGTNLQTIPDAWPMDADHPLATGMRDLFIADEGYLMAKLDLKGADGWTIGAYMAKMGDRTMFDDLLAGIKPAQVSAHMLIHGAGPMRDAMYDRPKVKSLCTTVPAESWQYFVSKVLVWGAAYLMGPRLAAESVFIQSDGDILFTERQAKEFRALTFERYRFTLYHEHFLNELSRQDYPARLQCPDGSIRTFWGRNRRDKCEILGEALAHVPQVVTTHFIKMALRRLWMDDENWPVGRPRSLSSRPRVEPLHTTHDDLLVQFKVEDLDWALAKLRTWFDNELLVAGQLIKIPFDGSYGTDWAMSRKLGKI